MLRLVEIMVLLRQFSYAINIKFKIALLAFRCVSMVQGRLPCMRRSKLDHNLSQSEHSISLGLDQ